MWIINIKSILCILIFVIYLIFKISKKSCFDYVHFQRTFLINFNKGWAIFAKFLIYRYIMLIMFKKSRISNRFKKIDYLIVLIIIFLKMWIRSLILWNVFNVLIKFTKNLNFLKDNNNLIHSILKKKWSRKNLNWFLKFKIFLKKSFI